MAGFVFAIIFLGGYLGLGGRYAIIGGFLILY